MVSRNAGGHIRHAVRDILLLDARFGIDELVIVHHTDCGTLTFTDDWMRDTLKLRLGKDHSEEIDQIYWGGNTE
jgi:carbonic anhydrase